MPLDFQPKPAETHDHDRFEVSAEGLGRYVIDVSLPPGHEKGTTKYPVIVVTDGNLLFDLVQVQVHGGFSAAGSLLPPSIVVGVGYPADEGMVGFYGRRNFDFHGPWAMTDPLGQNPPADVWHAERRRRQARGDARHGGGSERVEPRVGARDHRRIGDALRRNGYLVQPTRPIVRDAKLLTPRRRAYYMAMPLTVPHYTIAEVDGFPEDGNRYEVLYGMLLVTPGPGPMHQIVLARLTMQLAAYLGPTGLALLATPGVVQTGPDTQLEPDLLVIPTHYPPPISWRAITDRWLAVEVSGRDSRIYDRDYKTKAYLDFGVREVWRLDLRDRLIYVSRPGAPPDLPHGEHLEWHPFEMPAPLSLDVRALFAGYESSNWS